MTRTKFFADRPLAQALNKSSKLLAAAAEELEKERTLAEQLPQIFEGMKRERFNQIADDAKVASHGSESLLTQVLDRHHRVQKLKRKEYWIKYDGEYLMLLGNGDQGNEMPSFDGRFLHPFRVKNAYSLLRDLGQVKYSEATDDEED